MKTTFLLLAISVLPLYGCEENHAQPLSQLTVNDVTQLNPITMNAVIVPHSLDEIVAAVRGTEGPLSIGGGRFSMGGQTAIEHGTQLDMREYNRIIELSPERKEITVQSGATWRQIQEAIDPFGLSVKIMQTYANFTVGGALSVNAHGRYMGQGPIILSVKRIGIVLADGTYLNASPTENSAIFFGAIGGYGGIGVIADATLALEDNVRLHRVSQVMPLASYKAFFDKTISDNPDIVFHNAAIYPDRFDTVRSTSYERTDLPVTETERLMSDKADYRINRTMMALVSGMPGGKYFRQHVLDPYLYRDERVVWRNHEASYSVMELEPASRKDSTYVLQEYFIPVDKIDTFVPMMAKILNGHGVNVINISIRHAKQDPGSLLAWARGEVFAFVLYYKQGTTQKEKELVGDWTRELVDAALSQGGSYYLPYQIHAAPAQFKAAYPGWEQWAELKRSVDPSHKFTNKLLDTYFRDGKTVAADGQVSTD